MTTLHAAHLGCMGAVVLPCTHNYPQASWAATKTDAMRLEEAVGCTDLHLFITTLPAPRCLLTYRWGGCPIQQQRRCCWQLPDGALHGLQAQAACGLSRWDTTRSGSVGA